jgi:hypothetical protein
LPTGDGEQPLGRQSVCDSRISAARPQGLYRVSRGCDPDPGPSRALEV